MKTITEVRQSFWASHPEYQNDYRKTWKQNQYPTDIRVSFVDYVDHLRSDDIISERLAWRATL